jgi:hypothetical protein
MTQTKPNQNKEEELVVDKQAPSSFVGERDKHDDDDDDDDDNITVKCTCSPFCQIKQPAVTTKATVESKALRRVITKKGQALNLRCTSALKQEHWIGHLIG